jgi:hypothetical protein
MFVRILVPGGCAGTARHYLSGGDEAVIGRVTPALVPWPCE